MAEYEGLSDPLVGGVFVGDTEETNIINPYTRYF